MAKDVVPVSGEAEVDPRIQRKIWKLLGRRSAREIASEVGLPPEEVLRIKREMLDEVDILSVTETKRKLLSDLQDISQRLQDDYDASPWEFKSGIANSSIAAMKTVLGSLKDTSKGEQEAVDRLNALRVRELLSLMQEVVERGVKETVDRFDLDEDEVFGIFNVALAEAAQNRDEESA